MITLLKENRYIPLIVTAFIFWHKLYQVLTQYCMVSFLGQPYGNSLEEKDDYEKPANIVFS